MLELLSDLCALLKSHEGIYGTVPSKYYVTKPNALLEKSCPGVATESGDGKITYFHVMNLPEDGILKLSLPADGKKFVKAAYQGVQLPITETEKEYEITLPEECDEIDTVIALS